jgi:hypothetical protein
MPFHSPFRPATFIAAAPVAVALLAGCGGDEPSTLVERSDSAGIAIVVNRGGDQPLSWTLDRRFSLGGADDGPEAFYNVGRGSLATDDAGHLYILDRGNHRILVFDGEGRHLRELGRRGGGPGELQWPAAITVARDGSLAISDIGHRGLVRVTATGEPLEHRVLEGWSGGGIAAFGDGLVVQLDVRSDQVSRHELTRIDDTGRHPVVASDGARLRPIDLGCVQISGMSQLFAPSLVWAAGAGRIAAVTGSDYDIHLYDADGPVARVRRDLPPRPATRELALQEVGEKFEVGFGGGGGCVAEPAKVVDERGVADVIPAIRRLAVAPDGTLWVQRFAVRGDPAAIDVFAAAGEYLGTLAAGTPFPEAFFPDGRVVALERDDLDVDHVVVYEVWEERGDGPRRVAFAARRAPPAEAARRSSR